MDPDEALARALQEEEDRTTAAALLAAEARDADGGGEHARRVAFGARLESGVRTALAFEDPAARAHALSVVPVDRLEAEAAALVAESEAAANAHDADDGDDAAGAKPLSLEDAVLLRAQVRTWAQQRVHSALSELKSDGFTLMLAKAIRAHSPLIY